MHVVLNFAILIFVCPIFREFSTSRKSRNLVLAKLSENKVHVDRKATLCVFQALGAISVS